LVKDVLALVAHQVFKVVVDQVVLVVQAPLQAVWLAVFMVVVVVNHALVVEAQSALSGPVVQDHSRQHERQMSNKYESLY